MDFDFHYKRGEQGQRKTKKNRKKIEKGKAYKWKVVKRKNKNKIQRGRSSSVFRNLQVQNLKVKRV